VLHEAGAEYFDGYYPSPFMLLVLPVRHEKREVIPAVTHVDGTGRVQSVTPEGNAAFHAVIDAFRARTGVPVVLNTSYNLRGEPIVNTPEQAIEDYLSTGMDALMLGPYLLEKTSSARS
jgi:carbamoyltransferase